MEADKKIARGVPRQLINKNGTMEDKTSILRSTSGGLTADAIEFVRVPRQREAYHTIKKGKWKGKPAVKKEKQSGQPKVMIFAQLEALFRFHQLL